MPSRRVHTLSGSASGATVALLLVCDQDPPHQPLEALGGLLAGAQAGRLPAVPMEPARHAGHRSVAHALVPARVAAWTVPARLRRGQQQARQCADHCRARRGAATDDLEQLLRWLAGMGCRLVAGAMAGVAAGYSFTSSWTRLPPAACRCWPDGGTHAGGPERAWAEATARRRLRHDPGRGSAAARRIPLHRRTDGAGQSRRDRDRAIAPRLPVRPGPAKLPGPRHARGRRRLGRAVPSSPGPVAPGRGGGGPPPVHRSGSRTDGPRTATRHRPRRGHRRRLPLARPQTKWEAIRHGERIAVEERRRLGLGLAPLPNVAELLEVQGVHAAQVTLPDDVSGLTLIEPDIEFLVVANRDHHVLRRRFSFAHEYCHVLADRERRGLVSRGQDRDELLEVRANAFAASLLMPADAVRQFVQALGKGQPSRMEAEVFDDAAPVQARARSSR